MTVYLDREDYQRVKTTRHEIEMEFDEDDGRQIDLMAAVIKAGLDNIDDVAATMQEYGYGIEL